jgi:hypothetical protein
VGFLQCFSILHSAGKAAGLCKRRQASSISSSENLSLPGWSWVGWKCALNISIWSCESDYFKSSRDRWTYRHFGPRIISTVQWYGRERIDGQPILIDAPKKTQELKDSSMRDGCDTPIGWAQHKFVPHPGENNRNMHANTPHYFYTHESDPTCEFWYPILICDSPQPATQTYLSLLSCRTQKACLFLADKFSSNSYCYSMRDSQNS